MSSFNVILPSDSNKKLYPQNTKSRYKVRLNIPVDLDQRGEWEIAVSDLHVPAKISKTISVQALLTHPSSVESSCTSTLEELEERLNEVLGRASVHTYRMNLNRTICSFGVTCQIAGDGTVTFKFLYEGMALIPHEIWNVIFYFDAHTRPGVFPNNNENYLFHPGPTKLRLGKEISTALRLGGSLDPMMRRHWTPPSSSESMGILSPFAPLPRLDFNFNWYASPTSRDLILPLNLDTGLRQEVYSEDYYVMYMQVAHALSKPKVIYIPKSITEGLVGIFISVLRFFIWDVADRNMNWKSCNYYVETNKLSRLYLNVRVRKSYWKHCLSGYTSLLKIYIDRDLANALRMSDNSSIYLLFPNYNHRENLGELGSTMQFNVMPMLTGTMREQFTSYGGRYNPTADPTDATYMYHPKFKVGANPLSSMKLYNKKKFAMSKVIKLPQKYSAKGYVQWFNIHCPNLVQEVLRGVSRPQSSSTKAMSDIPLRHLHYKKLLPGTKRVQDFDIEFKDEHDEPVTFGPKGKTIMTVNFRPVKRRRLSHFNLNVPCQV